MLHQAKDIGLSLAFPLCYDLVMIFERKWALMKNCRLL